MPNANVLLPSSDHFTQNEQQSQQQAPQPQQQQLARFQPTTRPDYIPTPSAHIPNSLQVHPTSTTGQGGGQHVAQPRNMSAEQMSMNAGGPLELSTRRNSAGGTKKSSAQAQKAKQASSTTQPKQQQQPRQKQSILPLLKRLKVTLAEFHQVSCQCFSLTNLL